MELNKSNFVDTISSLSSNDRMYFYETLTHNLTIVCREIWSDDDLVENQKIEQMKWLNEILHRLVSKIQPDRLESNEWKEEDILQTIEHYSKQEPCLSPRIAWSLTSSYKSTIENSLKLHC